MIAPSWDDRKSQWYWPTPSDHPDYPGKVVITDNCQRIRLIGIPNPLPIEHAEAVARAITAAVIWKEHHS